MVNLDRHQISFLLSEHDAKVGVGLPEVCCTLTSHESVKKSYLGDSHVSEDRSTSLHLMLLLPIPPPINFKSCGFIYIYDICMCKSVSNSTTSNNDSKRKVFLVHMFQDLGFVSLVEDKKKLLYQKIWNITSSIYYIIPKMTIRSKRKYKLKL